MRVPLIVFLLFSNERYNDLHNQGDGRACVMNANDVVPYVKIGTDVVPYVNIL
mgnify:FL=1